jgi:hypothetical protein
MTKNPKPESKLTDAERHARFLTMAREVEASEKPVDFDKAFEKVTGMGMESVASPKQGPQTRKRSD